MHNRDGRTVRVAGAASLGRDAVGRAPIRAHDLWSPSEDSVVPTYAYRCTACGHRFDAVQRMADAPLTDCPSCAGFVRRTIQNVPVVFKGSGWYVTDSRKSNGSTAKDSAPAESDASKSTSGTGEKASEKAKSAKTEKKESAAAAD